MTRLPGVTAGGGHFDTMAPECATAAFPADALAVPLTPQGSFFCSGFLLRLFSFHTAAPGIDKRRLLGDQVSRKLVLFSISGPAIRELPGSAAQRNRRIAPQLPSPARA